MKSVLSVFEEHDDIVGIKYENGDVIINIKENPLLPNSQAFLKFFDVKEINGDDVTFVPKKEAIFMLPEHIMYEMNRIMTEMRGIETLLLDSASSYSLSGKLDASNYRPLSECKDEGELYQQLCFNITYAFYNRRREQTGAEEFDKMFSNHTDMIKVLWQMFGDSSPSLK